MRVLVFGAGSLGSLVGGALARAHDVTLVGRDPHVGAIRDRGLRVTGAFEFAVEPTARTTVPGDRFDLAVVTVKAYDTPTAADELAAADVETVVSLQNGMGNETRLAQALDAAVLAGTCTYGARLAEPGVVECTGTGDVVVGRRSGGESAAAERIADALREGGLSATAAGDMPRRLWEKLAVNAGVNAVTALARVPNGALVDGPAGEPARAAARETARVARGQGVDLSDPAAAEAVTEVADATARNTSSMRQDVEAGARTEIDAINGYVVAHAGERVPVNETLTALVRAWEREQGLRE